MLLKWLFTLLAIVWLYQAILPLFATTKTPKQTPPGSGKSPRSGADDEGDYIDYEEIK